MVDTKLIFTGKRKKEKKNRKAVASGGWATERMEEARREISGVTVKSYISLGVWVPVFVKTHQAMHLRYKYAHYSI